MNRREFSRVLMGAGVGLVGGVAGAKAAEPPRTGKTVGRNAGKPTFRDLGWAWEGQGLDPKVPPSIYG